ncbi:CopG family transcriptional regulator [Rathayibacter sp. AY1A7]|nr:CopG family transcriptional regulator [Rathayibacter sp. AY1A7]PPF34441.1 CopG family transcriptional regulator [Rathayibacter sp. AY1A3]
MNPETAAALKEFAQAKRLSYTEAVRRAIAIAKYIEDEVREGRKIQTVDADRNEVRELILM